MSISYSFTQRNSIRIECGDEWIEVSLPSGSGSDQAPQQPASAPEPAGPAAMPPKGKHAGGYRPPNYPGAMLVVANGKAPEDDQDYLGSKMGSAILDLADLDMDQLGEALKMAKPIGHTRTLDVSIDPGLLSETNALADLNQLIKDPAVALDALRLWKK